MRCPFCTETQNKVIDSRESQEGAVIRRRRECEKCAHRFTTYERVEELTPLIVKKDGRREAFDREKILSGLKKACEKRPVSMEQMEQVAERAKLVEDALSLGADLIFCADGTDELAVETHQQGRLPGAVEAFENPMRLVG